MKNYTDEEFTSIMNDWGDMVLRICFVRLRNFADAQDAFQEVFLKLYREKKPTDPSYLKPWLIRTACNTCVSHLRSRRIFLPLSEDIPAEKAFYDRTVVSAVLSLSQTDRTLVYLFYYEHLKTAEIARITGMKDATVRTRLHRARLTLKEILQEDLYEEPF